MDYYIIVRKTLIGGVPFFKKGRRWVKKPYNAYCFTLDEARSLCSRLNGLPNNPYFYTYELALPF